jgi:hypothetical protein
VTHWVVTPSGRAGVVGSKQEQTNMTDEEILVEQEKLVAENHAGRERSNWQREK